MAIDWESEYLNVRPKKLSENDLRYKLIICMLFELIKYYEDILSLNCGDSAFSNNMSCKLFEADNFVTAIRISFPNVRDVTESSADFEQHELIAERDMLNEHLSINCGGFIPPYRYGDMPHQKVSSLYLDCVWQCFERTDFFFYYIDSPYAFKQVEKIKNKKEEIPKI